MQHSRRHEILKDAWVGDAVLTLYVRSKILREDAEIDGEKSIRMTSNQFLTAFGEASEVEAQIGRVYAEGGLAQAFAWIEARILPTFEKQEENRRKRLNARRPG
ncbi:MAG: hypothetical protein ABI823_02270 [Bryobacteraceae bacterium]